MYRITANYYKEFFVYKDDVLILMAKRKYLFVWIAVEVFDHNENLIFKYRYFSFFFVFIKIKYQKLNRKIKKVSDTCFRGLCLKMDNNKIYCKLNSLPFKKIGRIEIEGKNIATIERKLWKSYLDFEVEFNQSTHLEKYCILLFLMNISAFESI